MTEASIKQKALTVANAFLGTDHATLALLSHQELYFALVHVVEQSEAFKQEVSDALFAYYGSYHNASGEPLERFIIGKPKSDPLVEVLNSLWGDSFSHFNDPEAGQLFRSALEARGLEIREKGQ
jgi:hypothetical protein